MEKLDQVQESGRSKQSDASRSLATSSNLSSLPLLAPTDGSSFFWTVALAYLIPAKDDDDEFERRYVNLFGHDNDVDFNNRCQNLFNRQLRVVERRNEVRDFFRTYNPLVDKASDNSSLEELITKVFRNRVMDHVESNRNLIQHESNQEKYIRNKRKSSIDPSSWANKPEIIGVIKKFNIHINMIGGSGLLLENMAIDTVYQGNVTVNVSYTNGNHCYYFLDQDIINNYFRIIVKNLENSFKIVPESSDDDLYDVNKSLSKQDIINLAEIEYCWIVNEDKVILHVVGAFNETFNRLGRSELNEIQSNEVICKDQGKSLTYLINMGSGHWVTLVIVYRDKQFFAYFVDPCGGKVPEDLKRHLVDYGIHCPNMEVEPVESDIAIFALKYAKKINDQLNQLNSFAEWIRSNLKKHARKSSDRVRECSDDFVEVKLSNLPFELVEVKNKLNNELNDATLSSRPNPSTFLIYPDDKPDVPAMLTLGIRDEQIVACYIANENSCTENVCSLFSDNGIVNILCEDSSKVIELEELNMDATNFIWHAAKLVTKYFSMNDYVGLMKPHLQRAKEKCIQCEIKKMHRKLYARKKIEMKIETCREEIRKYADSRRCKKDPKEFNHIEANLVVLFLESVALEDKEITSSLGQKVHNIRAKFIDDKDFEIINLIRSEYLLHRGNGNFFKIQNTSSSKIGNSDSSTTKDRGPKNKDLLFKINCKDMQKFVKDGIEKNDLFLKLDIYLDQALDKLNQKTIHRTSEVKIRDLFKGKNEVNRNNFTKILSVNKWLSCKFKELVNPNHLSKNIQQVMFDLTVNISPVLELLYSRAVCNPSAENPSKVSNKQLIIQELQNIKIKKNELLHKFHESPSQKAQVEELRKFILTAEPTLLKYIYSQEVFNILKNIDSNSIISTIDGDIGGALETFLNKITVQVGADSFESIAAILEPPTDDGTNVLKNFTTNYIKLMYVIDNEDELIKREMKRARSPKRYDQLNGSERKYIYECFRRLKQLYVDNSTDFVAEKEKSLKEMRNVYGIVKESFDLMVDSYVTDSGKVRLKKDDEGRIDEAICILSQIFNSYKVESQSLTLSALKKLFTDRNKKYLKIEKRSIEEKLKSIPKGKEICISKFKVNTDRFVINILEIFDAMTDQYKNTFKSIEEIFTNETFIAYLTNENIHFSREVWNDKLLQKSNREHMFPYIFPYIVELLVKDEFEDPKGLISQGLVDFNTLNLIIENLLKTKLYTAHVSKLFRLNTEKLSKIFSSQNPDECTIISKLYKIVCQNVNVNNIRNLGKLLQDEAIAPGILNELSNIILQNNGISNNLADAKLNPTEAILSLLDDVAKELSLTKDYKKLDTILNTEGINNLVSKLLQEDNPDLYALKIRRRVAILKMNKDEDYDNALEMLQEIKSKIPEDAVEDKRSFYLLILRDIAHLKGLKGKLSKSQKEYHNEACSEYKILCEKVVEYSLGNSYTLNVDDFQNIHCKIKGASTYGNIMKYDTKYLDILRIASDVAYEKIHVAFIEEEISQNEALSSYEEACKIYNQICNIRVHSDTAQKSVETMREIAFVKNKLGRLKSQSEDPNDLKLAIIYHTEAFIFYTRARDDQENIRWPTHPAVKEFDRNRIKTLNYIAITEKKLAELAHGNLVISLEHYNKALELYETVFSINKNHLSEMHAYNLITMNNIASTNNKIADLKAATNPEIALEHHSKVLELYQTVFNINKNLSKNHKFNLNTMYNIAITNCKIAEIKTLMDPEIAFQYWNVALELYKNLYDLDNEVYGEHDPRTLNCKTEIASTESRISSLSQLLPSSSASIVGEE